MAVGKDKIEEPCLLLVEGKDDAHFFVKLLTHIGTSDIQVWPIDGKDNKGAYKGIPKIPGYQQLYALGIVRDADDNSLGAFQSAQSLFKSTYTDFPMPEAMGVIAHAQNKRAGIFIMPDCNSNGMLEDLYLSSVKQDDLLDMAKAYIDYAEDYNRRENSDIAFKHSKSLVQAYLAGRVPLKNSLALAAEADGLVNFDSASFYRLEVFLRELHG